MVVALGEVETKTLIDDIILIAQGKNELHEKNPLPGTYKHSDGWGISYLLEGRWHTYKSVIPIYEDPKIHEFKDIKAKAVILHVRKATKGEKNMANTQPLAFNEGNKDFIFTHNGNIVDDIESKRCFLEGNSDTVMWFNKLLEGMESGQSSVEENNVYPFKNYSSANFFLVTPNKIVIGQKFKTLPNYHTMKLHKDKNSIIISSEVLPTMKDRAWKMMENDSIMELEYENPTYM